jgi:hypothetical protein
MFTYRKEQQDRLRTWVVVWREGRHTGWLGPFATEHDAWVGASPFMEMLPSATWAVETTPERLFAELCAAADDVLYEFDSKLG